MKYVYRALSWVVGIFFLLAGSIVVSEFPIAGLFLFLISLLLIPLFRSFVHSITGTVLPQKFRGLLVLLLFAAFGVSVVLSLVEEERQLAALAAQERFQTEFSLSQHRHGRFFRVDAWNHGDYVEDRGAGRCIICHSVEVGGPRLFGPRCLSCHQDIMAFRDSISDSQFGEGRQLVTEMQKSAMNEYARSQERHIVFFELDNWNHAEYVENNGEVLCVICHSLEAGGPNIRGRGPRCLSCHRDIDAFVDGIEHGWNAAAGSQ